MISPVESRSGSPPLLSWAKTTSSEDCLDWRDNHPFGSRGYLGSPLWFPIPLPSILDPSHRGNYKFGDNMIIKQVRSYLRKRFAPVERRLFWVVEDLEDILLFGIQGCLGSPLWLPIPLPSILDPSHRGNYKSGDNILVAFPGR